MQWRRVSALVVGALVSAVSGAGPAGAALPTAVPRPLALSGSEAAFHPVTPTRLADTRRSFGTTPAGTPAAGSTLTIQVTGRPEISIPGNATAVVLNVTAANATDAGYLSVYPHGTGAPNASNLNMSGAGYIGANLVTVKLGGGAVDVVVSATTDVLVDISGYYSPSGGAVRAGRTLTAGPTRLYDSRTLDGGGAPLAAGELRTIALPSLPAGASAAVLNVTVASTRAAGFWSIVPTTAVLDANGAPTTSSLNVGSAGATVASLVIVPVGADKTIRAYTNGGGDLILDLFGYVTGSSAANSTDGLFVPLDSPYRMIDTRTSNSPLGEGHRMWPGWAVEVGIGGRGGVPGGGVAAIVGNLTSLDNHDWGYLAAYPAGTDFPGTSSVNTDRIGAVVPNHVFVPISDRGVTVLASAGGHVLLDVSGYFIGAATTAVHVTPANVMPIPAFPLSISIPSIGVRASVQVDAQPDSLVSGPGWWPGTSYPGVSGNMAIFGHRTEHGGPFRNLNRVRSGDTVTLRGDRRTSVYVVQDVRVVPAGQASDYLGGFDGTMLTLIACSKADGSATSLQYRIIVTASLQSYRDA